MLKEHFMNGFFPFLLVWVVIYNIANFTWLFVLYHLTNSSSDASLYFQGGPKRDKQRVFQSKKYAPAGNWTRVSSLGSYHSTTKLLVPDIISALGIFKTALKAKAWHFEEYFHTIKRSLFLANLYSQSIKSCLGVEHERCPWKFEWPFGGWESEGELLLSFSFVPESAYFPLLWIKDQIFKKTFLAESSSDIFNVVRTLQVISLQKSISTASWTLSPVSNFIFDEIDCLKTKDRVVFVDPKVDSDYQGHCISWQMSSIVEGTFIFDSSSSLFLPGEGTAPFLGCWFLPTDDHSWFVRVLAGDGRPGSLGGSRFFLELYDNFGSGRSGYIGDEMFDVKLIL